MALRADAKKTIIGRVPLFEHCSKREITQIASLTDELEVPAGKVLIREGAYGREFFVVIEGEVEVVRNGRRVATLGSGDFVGEMAILSRRPRNATVTAKTPVHLLVTTDRAFRALLDRAPKIQGKILQALADRLAPTCY